MLFTIETSFALKVSADTLMNWNLDTLVGCYFRAIGKSAVVVSCDPMDYGLPYCLINDNSLVVDMRMVAIRGIGHAASK